MAEYWKSTPKYWCKFCEVFVKDTKFERSQHEATGRHQGNIQRSIRGIHKRQEIAEREKQKAKDEVARLSGLVPGAGSASIAGPAGQSIGRTPTFTKSTPTQASTADRKRQLAELAALGVAVPDDYRKEVAMIGDWEVVSQKVVGDSSEGDQPLNVGVRKRKLDEDEEEARIAGEIITKKKGWGQTFKRFPGSKGGADADLDALFPAKKSTIKQEPDIKEEVKEEGDIKEEPLEVKQEDLKVEEESEVKAENAETTLQDIPTDAEDLGKKAIKTEEDESKVDVNALRTEEASAVPVPPVVFKKRKKPGR